MNAAFSFLLFKTLEEFRQAIRAEFVKSLKKLGIDPDIHLGSPTTGVTFETSTHPYSLIDVVTPSATLSMSALDVILSSPISVTSIPFNPGKGWNVLGFSHSLHATQAHSPP